MSRNVKPVNGAAIYEAGAGDGKWCVWMTVLPDNNCAEPCYYIVQYCRTNEGAHKAADKWQEKENKIAIKTLLERIKASTGIYTKEEQRRYASLIKKMNKLTLNKKNKH